MRKRGKTVPRPSVPASDVGRTDETVSNVIFRITRLTLLEPSSRVAAAPPKKFRLIFVDFFHSLHTLTHGRDAENGGVQTVKGSKCAYFLFTTCMDYAVTPTRSFIELGYYQGRYGIHEFPFFDGDCFVLTRPPGTHIRFNGENVAIFRGEKSVRCYFLLKKSLIRRLVSLLHGYLALRQSAGG